MAGEAGGGDRADAVELVGHLEPNPVAQPEVGDDALLPLVLRRVLRAGESQRRRDRERESFAPRNRRRDGEDGGGVAAA